MGGATVQLTLFAVEACAAPQTCSAGSAPSGDESVNAGGGAEGACKAVPEHPNRRRRRAAAVVEEGPGTDLIRRSLPLTVPAPNWDAWCGRPLRVEIEAPRGRASLPMAMSLKEGEVLSPIPHGRFCGCKLHDADYWLTETDATHGTVLVPRGRFWIRDGKSGHGEERQIPGVRLRVADEDGFTRWGPCPDAAAEIARRLDAATRAARGDQPFSDASPELAEEDVDRMLAALVGSCLTVEAGLGDLWKDTYAHLEVTSRALRLTSAWCRAGRIRIEGALGIACEAEFDKLLGVRVSESVMGGEILIDLWRDGEGYGASWRLGFSSMPRGIADDPR
jgi:hypothetical protein